MIQYLIFFFVYFKAVRDIKFAHTLAKLLVRQKKASKFFRNQK